MIILGVVLGIIVLLVVMVISYKNKFVVLDNRVKNAWSQIEVQLQNRFSLIPNLVEIVKGYATHEKETFEGIANARAKYMSANTPQEKMDANNQLTGFLGRLFSITESYPELKANVSFENLQKQLIEVEDKIRFARQFYNDTATEYNQTIQMLPASFFAGFFNYHNAELFKANDIAKEEVKIKF
jgi:lemA protein